MIGFNLLDAFVKVQLRKKDGKEYDLQGILFRDNTDFGIILPLMSDVEEGLETITINSPLYPREFEFTPTKDFIGIKNDFLMFLPIEEIECNGEIKHKTRVYSKEELSTIRYTMRSHFGCFNEIKSSYFLSYLGGITKGMVCNLGFSFLGYTNQEDLQNKFSFVSTQDAFLYDGSPFINNNMDNMYPLEIIQGIFIKNPEKIPDLKNMPNMGIVVGFNEVFDLMRKL